MSKSKKKDKKQDLLIEEEDEELTSETGSQGAKVEEAIQQLAKEERERSVKAMVEAISKGIKDAQLTLEDSELRFVAEGIVDGRIEEIQEILPKIEEAKKAIPASTHDQPTTTTFISSAPSLSLSQQDIPRFSGRPNEKTVTTWIREMNSTFKPYGEGMKEAMKVALATNAMKDGSPAQQWMTAFIKINGQFRTWKELKIEMKKQWEPPNLATEATKE